MHNASDMHHNRVKPGLQVDLAETCGNGNGNENENGKGRQMVLCTVRVGTIISTMLFTMHAWTWCALLKEISAPRHQTRTQRYSVSPLAWRRRPKYCEVM